MFPPPGMSPAQTQQWANNASSAMQQRGINPAQFGMGRAQSQQSPYATATPYGAWNPGNYANMAPSQRPPAFEQTAYTPWGSMSAEQFQQQRHASVQGALATHGQAAANAGVYGVGAALAVGGPAYDMGGAPQTGGGFPVPEDSIRQLRDDPAHRVPTRLQNHPMFTAPPQGRAPQRGTQGGSPDGWRADGSYDYAGQRAKWRQQQLQTQGRWLKKPAAERNRAYGSDASRKSYEMWGIR